ncbi:MAG: hypothetical protein HY721_33710 [Planctomycetes bacterium]|nr:hypothetical protein [Planctomycetota bacterium]
MNPRSFVVTAALLGLLAAPLGAQQLFNVPVRINMGDIERVDSYDRIWLGDGPGTGDPLNIRPDDAGGANTIPAEGWSLPNLQPDSMEALGFDPLHDGDLHIFNSIRWDNAAIPGEYRLEIPLIQGDYTVNFYFNEACCTARHFQIEIQGEIVDDDVSYLDYDAASPALGRMGRLSFPAAVGGDNLLRLALLPCNVADCPGATDFNAILNALEVISHPDCDHLGLDFNGSFDAAGNRVELTWLGIAGADGYRVIKNGTQLGGDLPPGTTSLTDTNPTSGGGTATYVLQALDGVAIFKECRAFVNVQLCPRGLTCGVDEDALKVALAWLPAANVTVTGIEVRRDGDLIATLAGGATSYEDSPGKKSPTYEVKAITDPPDICAPMTCSVTLAKFPFPVPLRINMGGVETVDSKGRVWLGDGPGAGDPLGIRPEDASGTNTIENWCGVDATSLRALGFNPADPNDRYIMQTIRWDVGPISGDAVFDFYVELAVPNAPDYLVNLYFNECCCTNRHFKIEIQDEILNPDVSYEDYAAPPGLGKVGRLSFKNIAVTDGILRVGFLPCDPADCPGTGDNNAIVNAIEVITDPCAEPGFRECPGNLTCRFIPLGKRVSASWEPALCFQPDGYELFRDGALIQSLPGTALTFTDTLPGRVATYEVRPIVPEGIDPCLPMVCTVVNEAVPFTVPLRLNMGGESLADSRGQRWIGDGPGPGDRLGIRPDDLGGTNTILNWCVAQSQANADSLRSLGFDAGNENDQAIFNTVRWDVGDDDGDFCAGELTDPDGGDTDYRLALPVPNADYIVNLYFTECCCAFRHFQVEIEGEIVDDDVSSADYSAVASLGRTGRLTFEGVTVADGVLDLAFLPFPSTCPIEPGLDTNAIVNAIEVLAAGTVVQTCPRDLLCQVDPDGAVTGAWVAAENMAVGGYEVYRGDEKIATLPADATSFRDPSPPCVRRVEYSVAVLPAGEGFLCPGLRLKCAIYQPECPFGAPLRINMGGSEVLDSNGNVWLGDGPGAGDPLEIRPDDASGTNWIENWCAAAEDSMAALGFDPANASDRYVLQTIRWDLGTDGIDFRLEIPFEDGTYTVNLYFNECCCVGRHFKIEIQGEIVDDDVSYLDYDLAAPGLGRVGRLTFEGITVDDGLLRIAFLPCPECPGALDTNAIVNGIEVLGSGQVPPNPPRNLVATAGDGQVSLAWDAPDGGAEFTGYAVYRDGTKITDLPVTPRAHTDLGRTNGVEYCFEVRATRGAVRSGPSNKHCATPQGGGVAVFHRGDADQNAQLQLTDAIQILGFLFLGIPTKVPDCPDAADADDNGALQLTDAIRVLGFLFLGLGPPETPGPPPNACGSDPTPDDLGGCVYTGC